MFDNGQKCRVCGCTWFNACPGGCWWVEEDLCSRCADDAAETILIRMLENVRPEFLFLAKPGTILRAGNIYSASANQHGAISAVCENGESLGVKPGEFEFVTAPQWLLDIHSNAGQEGRKA